MPDDCHLRQRQSKMVPKAELRNDSNSHSVLTLRRSSSSAHEDDMSFSWANSPHPPGVGSWIDRDHTSLSINDVFPNRDMTQRDGSSEQPSTIVESIELCPSINEIPEEECELLLPSAEISLGSHSTDSLYVPRATLVEESSWIIALQVVFPFLIAGCGTVGAGLVLDEVQHWNVFTEVPEIFVLVPALLGLKGNLEMTLASRLSTQANLGRMDSKKDMLRQIGGNLALVQAQALVVAFLAAVFAIALGWVPKGSFSVEHAVLLCASSMATAATASFVLSCVMIGVVVLSRRFHINPDNVATPIAASLGDLTTLGLLALIATLLHRRAEQQELALGGFFIIVLVCLTPLWIWLSYRNLFTRQVLIDGWTPVVFSMIISSAGGFILEATIAQFHGIAVFQPVINGIGGNLVAVQASRLSTSLHKHSTLGVTPSGGPKGCPSCCGTFCDLNVHSRATRVLLLLVIPGQLIFMYMIHFLRAGHTTITPLFAVVYLAAASIQVALLLYICMWIVHFMWRRKIDPDNHAIPYLTALGDLLGTVLLAAAFHILYLLGDKDKDVGD